MKTKSRPLRFLAWIAPCLFMLGMVAAPASGQDHRGGTKPADPERPAAQASEQRQTIVTATGIETDVKDVPADAWVIGGERLAAPGLQNIREALQHIPGVQLNQRQENGMFIGGLEIRGFSSNLTSGGNALILLDGIPQRRLSFGGPYMGSLPFEAVERAELVKGPLSALYGRGSLAGALQLFTRDGAEELGVRTRTLFDGQNGLFKQALTISGPIDGLYPGSGYSVSTSLSVADGWQERTESDKHDLYANVSLQLTPEDRLRIIAGYFKGYEEIPAPTLLDQRGKRLPGLRRDQNLAVPGLNDLDMEEFRAAATWTHQFDDSLESEVSVAYWQATTNWGVGRNQALPVGNVLNRPARTLGWSEDSLYLAARMRKEFEVGSNVDWSLTVGGSFESMNWDQNFRSIRLSGGTFGEGIPLNLGTMLEPDPSSYVYGDPTTRETEELHWGVFASNQIEIGERLAIDFGLRLDGYTRDQANLSSGTEGSNSEVFLSPRIAASYVLVDDEETYLTAYSSWGQGFNPVFRQVASNEVVDLDPESSTSIEVGLKGSLFDGALDTTFAAYQIEREDVVAFNPGASTFDNVGTWCVRGIELGLIWNTPVEHLQAFANYSYRVPEVDEDRVSAANEGNDLQMVPRHIGALGVRFLPPEGLGGEIRSRFVGGAYQDAANTYEVPSYVLLDANIQYRFEQGTVSVFGRNLLDEEYVADTFAGTTGIGFLGTPISAGVELVLDF